MLRHEKNSHTVRRIHTCTKCDTHFFSAADLEKHYPVHVESNLVFRVHKKVFDGASVIFRRKVKASEDDDPLYFFTNDQFIKDLLTLNQNELIIRKRMHLRCTINCVFLKFDLDGDIAEKISFASSSKSRVLTRYQSPIEISQVIRDQMKEMDARIQDFSENGSNWVLSEVNFFDATITTLGGLRGGCGFKYPYYAGLLNIQNKDQYCLLYCIAAYFHQSALPATKRSDPESYKPFIKNFDLHGLKFPLSPDMIDLLEANNDHLDFGVNVFTEVDNEVFIFRRAPESDKRTNTINVLLLEGVTMKNERLYHYTLITNPSRFLAKKYFRDGSVIGGSSSIYTCQKCFANFYSLEKKALHQELCLNGRSTKIIFPDIREKISFKKPWTRFPHILIGFVDFESILVKTEGILKQQYF